MPNPDQNTSNTIVSISLIGKRVLTWCIEIDLKSGNVDITARSRGAGLGDRFGSGDLHTGARGTTHDHDKHNEHDYEDE
jgi:hypothetical protein